MPSLHDQLKRAGAESRDHILRGHASCEDSAEHVRSSRTKVARSLDLLRERYDTGFDEGSG